MYSCVLAWEWQAIEATGVRLTGMAGGSAAFVSVGELRVTAVTGADC